jgi:hypothetical protein
MANYSNKWLEIPCPYTGEVTDIPPGYAARLAGVSRTTASRWIVTGIPEPALRLLQIKVHGLLPCAAWHRFRARGGSLLNVETGETFTPDQMATVYLAHQQASHYRQRLADLTSHKAPVLQLVPGHKKTRRLAGL